MKIGNDFLAMTRTRIARLRDKLLARGRPSQQPADHRNVTHVSNAELSALTERVRPVAEVIFLVLSADKAISEREYDVMRGALRSLTDGALSTEAMAALVDEFERSRERDGVEFRLDYLASALYSDRADARLALGLATAAADADTGVGPEEQAVIRALGERLGISRRELQEMMGTPVSVAT